MNSSTKTAQSFARASDTYDNYAEVQTTVGNRLIKKIPDIKPSHIVDFGCGTGKSTQALANRFPEALITATDINQSMVSCAKKKHPAPNITYSVADIAELSLTGKESLIFSNAALQWVPNLEKVFTTIASTKSPQSVLAVSLFGPQTFHQLKMCLEIVFKTPILLPANSFHDALYIQNIAQKHFKSVALDQEIITVQFPTIKSLFESIKYTGTRGNGIQLNKSWTRRDFTNLEQCFLENYVGVQISYQLFYLIIKD
ncbi:hypothetical protein DID80_03280 [Candidatus Marinamargulisbacteria bacterium SCGC AAA071-K20]|nr:hypothetical protein DID80_03280 [Candidatus Marinamargulisbacteria bacterium SCGC AAA071-K20]